MKLVAVALLATAMLCNSTSAMAEGPVPFSALMQSADAQPSVPPIPDAKNQTPVLTQPARTTQMTTGGKVMTGIGVAMLAIGGAVIAGSALLHGFESSPKVAAGIATGGGLFAGGITLIVLGKHRRTAE